MKVIFRWAKLMLLGFKGFINNKNGFWKEWTNQPRSMDCFVSMQNKKDLVGVEVGVAEGNHVKAMFKILSIKKLFLVDPYYNFDNYLICCKNNLKKFEDRLEYIIKPSVKGVKQINDNSLDFVYLDGSHIYDDVVDDIDVWYSKVKTGGVIGGHDFDADYIGVCKAVFEFAFDKDLKVFGGRKDWWIIKK